MAGGEQQLVALPERDLELLGEQQHHLGARRRAAGLDEAQMPGRDPRVERQVELGAPPPLAPLAQQRPDPGLGARRSPSVVADSSCRASRRLDYLRGNRQDDLRCDPRRMMTSTSSQSARWDPRTAAPSALAFLALAIAGLLGQLALFGVFLADHGLDPGEFADQIFASTIAALTFADLMVCAVVFLAWLPREAARVGIRRWWPFASRLRWPVLRASPVPLLPRAQVDRGPRRKRPGLS